MAIFAASATPIPLYDIYRRSDGLSYSDLSLTAVVYFVGAVTALLFFGRISNHLGRKPVTLLSFALAAVACVIFLDVDSATPLIIGRLLLGLSCGLASSTVTSYIVDNAPPALHWLAAAIVSCGGMIGLTLGALASGSLAEYGPYPEILCYLVILVVLAICTVLVMFSPETVKRTPGILASLRPRFSMPHADRRLYPVAACTFVATWALGGFYQAFGPSIAADQLGSQNALTAALVFSSFMLPSAVGGPLNKFLTPVNAQRIGMISFTLALGAILLSLKMSAIFLFLTTSALAGIAQGVTLTGSIRSLLADIAPQERAGVLSLIYATSYTGAAIPSFISGQLSHFMNLFQLAVCYAFLAGVGCLITLLFARSPHHEDVMTPVTHSSS
ncbi:MFS transporter [Desulfogranum japonicum]|uniref:MFS transporter n=1 Tax=Desulfogranum japonicum TaxID=231447 RepID=UPI0006847C43|nr:MFS transporter [Desulfogranum japonicum]